MVKIERTMPSPHSLAVEKEKEYVRLHMSQYPDLVSYVALETA